MNHDAITAIITDKGRIPYGNGITPNPFEGQQKEWVRRHVHAATLKLIDDKIRSLMEPRFITFPETSECIAALITMTDSRRILEVGTCTGFGTLHMLKAVIGKSGASITSVDARPAHDKDFWNLPQFKGMLEHVEGWTPKILETLKPKAPFDLVFVDSDHSKEHTEKEFETLLTLTIPGSIFLWHDVPQWQTPTNKTMPPVRTWLNEMVDAKKLIGLCLPSCEQLDCKITFGEGYPREVNPGLGIYIRN